MPNYAGVTSVQPVSAGFAAPWQTPKIYTGKQTTSTTVATTVTLETVTTGKTFYITDMVISSDAPSGGSTTVDVRVQTNGVDIFRQGVHNLSPITVPGLETQPNAASGQTVVILLPITTSVQNVWFFVAGFEQ